MPIPIPRYATWRSLEPLLETVQAILVHEADPIVCEASETRFVTLANALSHARLDGRAHCKAFVAAQYYERKDLVRLAVVDDGCGFRATLSPRHPKLNDGSDIDAILNDLAQGAGPDIGLDFEP